MNKTRVVWCVDSNRTLLWCSARVARKSFKWKRLRSLNTPWRLTWNGFSTSRSSFPYDHPSKRSWSLFIRSPLQRWAHDSWVSQKRLYFVRRNENHTHVCFCRFGKRQRRQTPACCYDLSRRSSNPSQVITRILDHQLATLQISFHSSPSVMQLWSCQSNETGSNVALGSFEPFNRLPSSQTWPQGSPTRFMVSVGYEFTNRVESTHVYKRLVIEYCEV